ncbi:zf-HC2 domain-containing protein [Cellulomonas edaphi]|uniref:Zf-HC2 domain-containing protein n=1 Tax=Cellulomonas edaphi TaxID=3053468 RepID=A0ABT7S5C0_9CELL|nr:zf-HC2 domain-containing protein [Cellulomons edaphi]MDM7830818.1 zf-HC2 domain-containing protein [Cellulomons edaphi]
MSHLGSRLSALADGQLAPAAAERAMAHVAACAECAAELAAARAARAALSSAADPVDPAPDLAARLLSLAPSEPPAGPPRAADPFAPPSRRTAHDVASYGLHRGPARRVWAARTGGALCGEVPLRRVSTRLVVGSLAGVGAVAAMLFVLGERPTMAPEGALSADLELLGQATTGASGSGVRAAVARDLEDGDESDEWLAEHGWPFPADLPAGWVVTDVRPAADGGVEIDVAGPDGPVVVTEQAGRLDSERLDGAEQLTLGGREVALLSREPWHVVWQSGATVVQVVAAHESDAAADLVAGFPGGRFDDGVPARIQRGWTTVTGVFDQS